MKRAELKVGDEVAIGRERQHRLARAMVVDLRSWVRVYDKELGNAADVLRSDYDKEPKRYGSSKWSHYAPQSGILVRIHDRDDVWSEPRLIYVRDIRRFWPDEEARQAQLNEAEKIRRARVEQMKLWLEELEIDISDNWTNYALEQRVTISYEEIEKLVWRFQEAKLSG